MEVSLEIKQIQFVAASPHPHFLIISDGHVVQTIVKIIIRESRIYNEGKTRTAPLILFYLNEGRVGLSLLTEIFLFVALYFFNVPKICFI